LYLYPSHDIDTRIPENDRGDQYDMNDYHVFSMSSIDGEVVDHGVALKLAEVKWAGRQLWAPDAAFNNGTYYLYFPAKDKDGIFHIGVATSKSPAGPFTAADQPIEKSFSIDPCVFRDDDGSHYMYFGGIWGGQLQNWRSGKFNAEDQGPVKGEVALGPRMARLNNDMTSFAEEVKDIVIVDEAGTPLKAEDNEKRFFEAAWMHKYEGRYYLSYSTGDTHKICYAISSNPYGPFKYQGVILQPVLGWTNHHSIVEFNGRWYLFYHDSEVSKGRSHLRNVKVTPLTYLEDGSIQTIEPYTGGPN
jgi:beta-xylosidase